MCPSLFLIMYCVELKQTCSQLAVKFSVKIIITLESEKKLGGGEVYVFVHVLFFFVFLCMCVCVCMPVCICMHMHCKVLIHVLVTDI